jgi:glycosyltransferase involved in cell wall biosynthesis
MDILGRILSKGRPADRVVLDWVDAPSLLHEREMASTEGRLSTIQRFRIQQLVEWQRSLNARAEASIYIAALDREHAGEAENPDVHVVPNGVLETHPDVQRGPDTPTIGFLGNMAYGPNVRACMRLHDRVFLPLSESHPELRLKIIGRTPAPEIEALAGPRVEVTGAVESIWPHLAEVALMVFPMETGGGLQNKVLESIAAGCAVVATSVGVAGIDPEQRASLLVEDTDEGMIARVRELLENPRVVEKARSSARGILDYFDWETILPRYERIVLGSPGQPASGGSPS